MNESVKKIMSVSKLHEDMRKEMNKMVSSGSIEWHYEKIKEYVTVLFDRFAPFKEGDRVCITNAPNCDNGWRGSKHFLIVGAEGTVQSVDYRRGGFCASILFDNQSWINMGGEEVPVEERSSFLMPEKSLYVSSLL